MGKKKNEVKSICHPSIFSILPLSSRKAVKEAPANFPQKKHKGFIEYVFCRNWDVRNPAGTRLDSSSLVNKEVGVGQSFISHGPSETVVLVLGLSKSGANGKLPTFGVLDGFRLFYAG